MIVGFVNLDRSIYYQKLIKIFSFLCYQSSESGGKLQYPLLVGNSLIVLDI